MTEEIIRKQGEQIESVKVELRKTEESIDKTFKEKIEEMQKNRQGQSNQMKVNLQERSEKMEEVQKKSESEIKEIHKEVQRQAEENENSNNKKLSHKEGKQKHKTNVGLHEDADNIVDFTDMSPTKKLSTVGSNVSVSSNLQNKQTKKKDDFISLHLTVSEVIILIWIKIVKV